MLLVERSKNDLRLGGAAHVSLRFLRGGRAPIVMGSFTVHVTGEDEALPFVVDAIAVEEDRWLSLAAPKEIVLEDVSPLRTINRAHDLDRLALGSVDVRAGHPAVLRAIVIDVDAEPSCLPASVAAATIACLRTCRDRRFDRLRLPLLGSDRGGLSFLQSARTILQTLLELSPERGRLEIVVVAPMSVRGEVQELLSRLSPGPSA